MKKCIKILWLIMLVISLALSVTASADDGIKVTINGKLTEFDVPPQLINDRAMVPFRTIFETLGAEVEWNDDTQTVSAIKGDVVVVATIGSQIMYINDEEKVMDIAPIIIDERTLVPVRFVAEAFECEVEWNDKENTVVIIAGNDLGYSGLPDSIISEQYE